MNHRSLPFRLGALYTLLMGATFIVASAATIFGLQHYLRSNLRDSLKRRSTQVEQIVAQAGESFTDAAIAPEIETRVSPEFNNRFVRVTHLPDRVVYRSGPPADRSFDPAFVDSLREDARLVSPVTEVNPAIHMMVRSTDVKTRSGTYRVELGVSIQTLDEVLDRVLDLLVLLLPLLLLCAAAGGYWLIKRALLPVDQLSQTAEQMSLQNLNLRLPIVHTGDALERLSVSLNNMLGRLLDSVQTSRRFLADASHELRTPLTIIKGELQELAHEDGTAEVSERVGSVLEEVARLEHLVSGLLVLSRLDAGERQGEWAEVDLAELCLSTAEQMRLIAEDRGIAIGLSGLSSAIVYGDRSRLKQIIVNLLDNAIRFTPRGGAVSIRTAAEVTGSVLEVSDTGRGIPAAAIPYVFDRFYRVDAARSREDGGAGLGLSIVKSIGALHGADVDVASAVNGGSTFCLRFPHWPPTAERLHTAIQTLVPAPLPEAEAPVASSGAKG